MKTCPYRWFLAASLVLHGLVAWGMEHEIMREPQYAVAAGHGSYAVDLVVGTPDAAVTPPPPPPAPQKVMPQDQERSEPEGKSASPAEVEESAAEQVAQHQLETNRVAQVSSQAAERVKDESGQSGQQGNAAQHAVSAAASGAVMVVQPDYLSNPPPLYPDAARRKRQQGLVLLKVWIDTQGRAERIAISASSGFAVLDQEAVKAVQRWRFRAARCSGVLVRSVAEVPVRFKLE